MEKIIIKFNGPPFDGQELVIDFSNEKRIFCLSGLNGAGKTTLLDSVLSYEVGSENVRISKIRLADSRHNSIDVAHEYNGHFLKDNTLSHTQPADRDFVAGIFDEYRSVNGQKEIEAKDITNNKILRPLSRIDSNVQFKTKIKDLFISYNTTLGDHMRVHKDKRDVSKVITSFNKSYGYPNRDPKDFINTWLRKLGLKIEVDLRGEIKDKTTGEAILVDKLSSGEKRIIDTILLIYQNAEYNNRSEKKIYVLDEPDSNINPSLSEIFIEALYELVHNNKNSILLFSTHSPVTIASFRGSDMQNIWLKRNNRNKLSLEPITAQESTDRLLKNTSGVAISEKQAVVFVEGKDSDFYSLLFGNAKKYNKSIRGTGVNLVFAPYGDASKTGSSADIISIFKGKLGCHFKDSNFFYGIIDRDCNKGEGPVENNVFYAGNRYCKENYLRGPDLYALIDKDMGTHNSYKKRVVLALKYYNYGASLGNIEIKLAIEEKVKTIDMPGSLIEESGKDFFKLGVVSEKVFNNNASMNKISDLGVRFLDIEEIFLRICKLVKSGKK